MNEESADNVIIYISSFPHPKSTKGSALPFAQCTSYALPYMASRMFFKMIRLLKCTTALFASVKEIKIKSMSQTEINMKSPVI
jgi:hypothetical protein